jgi:hypothetical protein
MRPDGPNARTQGNTWYAPQHGRAAAGRAAVRQRAPERGHGSGAVARPRARRSVGDDSAAGAAAGAANAPQAGTQRRGAVGARGARPAVVAAPAALARQPAAAGRRAGCAPVRRGGPGGGSPRASGNSTWKWEQADFDEATRAATCRPASRRREVEWTWGNIEEGFKQADSCSRKPSSASRRPSAARNAVGDGLLAERQCVLHGYAEHRCNDWALRGSEIRPPGCAEQRVHRGGFGSKNPGPFDGIPALPLQEAKHPT